MNWRTEIITRNLQTLEGAHHLCPRTREFLAHIKDIGGENLNREDFNRLQAIAENLVNTRTKKKNEKQTKRMIDIGNRYMRKEGAKQ